MPVIRRLQEGSTVEPLQPGRLACLAVLLGLEQMPYDPAKNPMP